LIHNVGLHEDVICVCVRSVV